MQKQELLEKARSYLPPDKLGLVEAAYDYAVAAHQGQVRESGEPFLEHPLQTALTLAGLQLDAQSLAAGLLHDVSEDCGIPVAELEKRFGPEVARLVDGVTKLQKIPRPTHDDGKKRDGDVESLRKMLVAMAEDIRVVLIKLADRLHNMRTLRALSPAKQREIARETLEIYAPLAHRLGMWDIKWQLEDLAFSYTDPDDYHRVAHLVLDRRVARERYISQATHILKEELEKAGVKAEVTGRAKHLYSIHRKIQKYAEQGKDFSDIFDLLALRVMVDEMADCYNALGVVHSLWHPIPGNFDDYIANPKENLYQSLHTTVMGPSARPLEIQIRTRDMHRIAELGIAAHWRYKEGAGRGDQRFEERMSWLRQLLDWQRELSGADFLESVKSDIFPDQVFVYTPKGEIRELPAGATPLDFAYRIHTDLGHRCIGAKVNGKLVPLTYRLQNGDSVEILTTKGERGPSRDWLNADLGYVQTSHGREKVRQWFRHQERASRIQTGREMLEKELKRLGLPLGNQEKIASLFNLGLDDLLAAVGSGEIDHHQIAAKLTVQEEAPIAPAEAPRKAVSGGVQVLGVGDVLSHLSRCCNPVPGDKIVGYITRSRGVSVHRQDCHNVAQDEARMVKVDWGPQPRLYPVSLLVQAYNRVGLLRDVTTVVSGEKVNISSISNTNRGDGSVSIFLTVETTGLSQLSRLFSRLEAVPGVFEVGRSTESRKESPGGRDGAGRTD